MNIYVAHSTSSNLNFQRTLYQPIRQSYLNTIHNFTLPHESSSTPDNSKERIKNNFDIVIAEVTYPSTGLGIELGWADCYQIPIYFIHQPHAQLSSSLTTISQVFLQYNSSKQLIDRIKQILISSTAISSV